MSKLAPDASIMGRMLDGLCVGLVAVDPSGAVVWMNRASQSALGLDAGEARGKPLTALLRDPQIAEFWHRALESEVTTVGQVSLHWPRRAELKANATVALDTAGNVIGRALLFCDVTTEREIQVQLSQEATLRLLDLTENWNESAEARAGLTGRELSILKFVGAGRSNPEIAEEMEVAVSTVRSHLKSLYGKLGLKTRSEAISYALRNGLG